MKERPILFSAPMVRALLAGTKTQTRRVSGLEVINADPERFDYLGVVSGPGEPHYAFHDKQSGAQTLVRCRSGQPGDRLWVRETFYAWGRWETRYSAKKRRDEWHFEDLTLESGKSYSYSADGDGPMFERGKRNAGVLPGWWKRPAIFMPRAASRITLEITSVRVERLQTISFADAAAEGLHYTSERLDRWSADGRAWAATPKNAYRALWEQINGPASWDANPWVWAITFKRLP